MLMFDSFRLGESGKATTKHSHVRARTRMYTILYDILTLCKTRFNCNYYHNIALFYHFVFFRKFKWLKKLKEKNEKRHEKTPLKHCRFFTKVGL